MRKKGTWHVLLCVMAPLAIAQSTADGLQPSTVTREQKKAAKAARRRLPALRKAMYRAGTCGKCDKNGMRKVTVRDPAAGIEFRKYRKVKCDRCAGTTIWIDKDFQKRVGMFASTAVTAGWSADYAMRGITAPEAFYRQLTEEMNWALSRLETLPAVQSANTQARRFWLNPRKGAPPGVLFTFEPLRYREDLPIKQIEGKIVGSEMMVAVVTDKRVPGKYWRVLGIMEDAAKLAGKPEMDSVEAVVTPLIIDQLPRSVQVPRNWTIGKP